ncbi:TetR/AcrR family transcriptional regulator [Prauserella flavalba]|uniref:TetR/AcrR family transcriptional regulator n=1 Tax=Prauserella flavalba TaxID=1477506 RepID=UPI0036E4FBC3
MPPKKDSRRHAEVLDAAIALIRRKGLDGTSIQDIADAVGIKKGSLLNYFASKAELAELIQDRFTEIATDRIAEIAGRDEIGPERRLRELLKFHAEHCAIHISSPVLVSFMQLWAPIDSELGARQLAVRERYESHFRDELKACVRQRIIRKVDVGVLTPTLMGAVSWTAFWYRPEQHGPLGALVEKQIDWWLDGLRPRSGTKTGARA